MTVVLRCLAIKVGQLRATELEDPRPVDWQRNVLAWVLLIDGRPEEALADYAQIQDFCLSCKLVALVRTGRCTRPEILSKP
jgi:hypothetical protein